MDITPPEGWPNDPAYLARDPTWSSTGMNVKDSVLKTEFGPSRQRRAFLGPDTSQHLRPLHLPGRSWRPRKDIVSRLHREHVFSLLHWH